MEHNAIAMFDIKATDQGSAGPRNLKPLYVCMCVYIYTSYDTYAQKNVF